MSGLLHSRAGCFDTLVGVGGIGAGILFALEGDQDLGRNESRGGRLLESRDYCKLHIIAHFMAVFTGARPGGRPFHVLPVGKVGHDATGERLLAEMKGAGMDCRFVGTVPDLPTLFAVCYQFPDGAGGNLTPTNAAPCRLSEADLDAVQPWLDKKGNKAMALAAPEVPMALRKSLLQRATGSGAFRVASFVPGEMGEALESGLLEQVDLLAVNEDEAAALTGTGYSSRNPEPLLNACADFARRNQLALKILLSVGAAGVYGFESGRWVHRPALPVKPVSTAGAGDTLLGGVLAALAAGLPFLPEEPDEPRRITSALDFGNLAAGLSVLSLHTIDPGLNLESLRAGAVQYGFQMD